MTKRIWLGLGLLMSLAPGVWAQLTGGNIYGTVADEAGGVLPGAAVTLSSDRLGGSRSTTTSTQGDFRFLGVNPGTYNLSIVLQGFTTTKRQLIVNTGVNAAPADRARRRVSAADRVMPVGRPPQRPAAHAAGPWASRR